MPGWHTACTITGEIPEQESNRMSGLLRTGAAGYGAYKLGGGCVSTVLIFIVLYWILGAFC